METTQNKQPNSEDSTLTSTGFSLGNNIKKDQKTNYIQNFSSLINRCANVTTTSILKQPDKHNGGISKAKIGTAAESSTPLWMRAPTVVKDTVTSR